VRKKKGSKMSKKMIKKITMVMACSLCILALCGFKAQAKSLAESFSGDSYYPTEFVNFALGIYSHNKVTYAKTSGYTEGTRYYLRSYIGGSSSSATGAVADSGRQFFTQDGYVSCKYCITAQSTDATVSFLEMALSPTGYAKYGR
jgi:hypothetical protein